MSDLFTATTSAEVEECLARGDNLEEEREGKWKGETPLISSIKRGNKQVFFSLLQHGADPSKAHKIIKKPIQWAASEGWKDMVEALVKAGANINENEGGWGTRETSLHIAAEKGAVDVTEGLLALGAEKETRDANGHTPLMKACEKGHEDVADRLLAAGAIVNTVTLEGVNALIFASISGHLGIVDRLVIHGANINHQNKTGWTALMCASYIGRVPVVDRLVGLGCDLNLQDSEEKTALMRACQHENVEIVKILLAHGADTQIKNNDGHMAFDLTRSQEIHDLLRGKDFSFFLNDV